MYVHRCKCIIVVAWAQIVSGIFDKLVKLSITKNGYQKLFQREACTFVIAFYYDSTTVAKVASALLKT